MTALTQNIKKYFVGKLIDFVNILLFFGGLVFAFFYVDNPYAKWGLVVGVFIGMHFLGKYTSSKMDKWIVENMDYSENIKYSLIDTGILLFVAGALLFFLGNSNNIYLLLIFVVGIVLIKEIPKWWKIWKLKPAKKEYLEE